MELKEAVEKAMERGCCIARRAWSPGYRFRVEPTNTPDCCVCHSQAMRAPGRCWQPYAEDLMADDWYLSGKYDGFEF